MTRHVIFLVHGMGEFSKGWSEKTQKHIKDLYAAYDISKAFAFDDFFRFEEITYNGRFNKLRKQWVTDSSAVLGVLKEGGLESGAVNELAKAAGTPGAENQFLSTHVLDVVLYRFAPQVAEEARNIVAKRIIETLLDPSNDTMPRWSLLAHSLGTAVAHDALHALFTQKVKGVTLAGRTKSDVLMMVANVSRLLEQKDVDVYKSVVRPGLSSDGVCQYYVNAQHEWDPLPRPKAFRPLDDWPDVRTRQEGRLVKVAINAFQHKNIHAFSHYLSHPNVHVALFRRLFPFDAAISEQELIKAVAQYEASTPFGQFEALQKELKEFQLAEQSSWQKVLKAFQGFFETVAAL